MTIEQLRAAITRTLRSHYVDNDDLADELASIADHHAAEEVAAARAGPSAAPAGVHLHVPIR